MSERQEKPVRLFVDPFAAWRELAFKTAEMIAASAQAGAAAAPGVRVAAIDGRPPAPAARKAAKAPSEPARTSRRARKKHKKRGGR